jgi:hypothetical protein
MSIPTSRRSTPPSAAESRKAVANLVKNTINTSKSRKIDEKFEAAPNLGVCWNDLLKNEKKRVNHNRHSFHKFN